MENNSTPPSNKFLRKLQEDIDTMRFAYPQFSLRHINGKYYWFGKVKLPLGFPFGTKEHIICMRFNSNYPSDDPRNAPRTYVNIPFPKKGSIRYFGNRKRLKRPPHIYTKDNALCLFDPEDPDPKKRWNPNDTIDVIVTWAILWLYEYYIWQVRGCKDDKWPAPEAPHRGPK